MQGGLGALAQGALGQLSAFQNVRVINGVVFSNTLLILLTFFVSPASCTTCDVLEHTYILKQFKESGFSRLLPQIPGSQISISSI